MMVELRARKSARTKVPVNCMLRTKQMSGSAETCGNKCEVIVTVSEPAPAQKEEPKTADGRGQTDRQKRVWQPDMILSCPTPRCNDIQIASRSRSYGSIRVAHGMHQVDTSMLSSDIIGGEVQALKRFLPCSPRRKHLSARYLQEKAQTLIDRPGLCRHDEMMR